jgi:hypothetical protein
MMEKNIYQPEDEEARQKAERDEASYAYLPNPSDDSVSFGDVAADSDGNVYLAHGGTQPRLRQFPFGRCGAQAAN